MREKYNNERKGDGSSLATETYSATSKFHQR